MGYDRLVFYIAQAVGAMGLIGLGLAVGGLYVVVAFAISRRTIEMGIRTGRAQRRARCFATV